MHQPVSGDPEQLKKSLAKTRTEYRAAVDWARRVLDYKKAFEREEDFGEDELRQYIELLRADSRDELKTVAINIKQLKGRIKSIQDCLIDASRKKK
jgi:hypothetical protein